MRSAPLLLPLLLLAGLAAAQTTAPVTGRVTDAQARPLSFTTAVLLHLPDSTVAASLATTEQGSYTFASVQPGTYCVKALLISYRPARSAAFVVAAGRPVTVPTLRLAAASTALREVMVTGLPPRLEQHADRTVINVARLNTAGTNALEVLQQAPGIRLDKDENIVYRGSTGINVLIDGKLTYMSGEVLKNYLKSLPASAISQIELLPNPPASMDAAGTAGVLNIRLKRNQLPGLSGTFNVGGGYGRFEKSWAGTNLAYNAGKVRLFARLDGGRYNSFNRLTMRRIIRDTVFNQENYWRPLTYTGNYAAGADVALNARHSLSLGLRGSGDQTTALSTANSVTTDAAGRFVERRQLFNPQDEHGAPRALNLNYRWTIDSTGRELSADADYVRYTSAKEQQFRNLAFAWENAGPGQDVGQLRSANSSGTTIRAAKIDYVHPFAGTQWRAETGAKTSRVSSRSAIQFDQLAGSRWRLDTLRTNSFQYDEHISAGYVSLSTTLGKLELKGGLRGELTQSKGNSPTTGQRVERRYFQLFPSAFAAYKINDNNQLSASVSRRITRPSYQDLNPFLHYTDFYTAHQGNPFLAPSLSQSLVASYIHKDFQVLSLSYLRETNAVNEVVTQDDQTKVSTTMPRNLGRATTLTLSSGGHTTLTKWWGMDNEISGSYNVVTTELEDRHVRLARFGGSASSNHTFTLPRQYQLLVGGYYNSPSVQGLFYTRSAGLLNLGLKKQLWAEKASLSLRLSDVFATNRFRSDLRYNNVNQTCTNQWESRRLTLTFACKLGSGKTRNQRNAGSQEEEGRVGR
ncbi:TonB-dependent receptor domain-containing protein [Hymenobacter actinosclerus]|uniref:Outer membrane receptor proteins, mostly Fe transport n=1 Tax=Hymenobacter actinosclerus TaxID=82805 RepID=A0A1I0HGV9_9BACT|nr:TonB-dependent receptor [Hymenobacter actinosclerus]SET82229.1 Outer membrane receptor proteins, mostly Fe transport [Hymenobacter actinosclerus]